MQLAQVDQPQAEANARRTTAERRGPKHVDDIDGFRVRLYFFSRDRSVLATVIIIMTAMSLGLAWLFRAPDAVSSNAEKSPRAALEAEIARSEPDSRKIVHLLPLAIDPAAADADSDLPEKLAQLAIPQSQRVLAQSLLANLREATGEPDATLLILAHGPEPAPFANEVIADIYRESGKSEKAVAYYERELAEFNNDSARAKLVDTHRASKNYAALRELHEQPAFAPYFTPRLMLAMAMHEHDWLAMLRSLIAVEMEAVQALPLALAIVAGLVWFIIAWQSGQPPGFFSVRTLLAVIALGMGVVASFAAHFVSIWQEELWDLHATGQFSSDFLFFLSDVAPRETALKLLFALPLLPFLLKRGCRLETLVVTGCVGLGFAVEGNLQYFTHAGPDGAFGRLLTANFFHFAASALVGLAFFDFLKAPRAGLFSLILALVGVTLAAGIYDAFFAVEGLRFFAIISMVSFLAVALVLFQKLRELRDPTTDQLYLAATLLLGLTLLIGTMLVAAATQIGFFVAVSAIATNVLGISAVIVIFYRQLGKGLTISDEFVTPVTT